MEYHPIGSPQSASDDLQCLEALCPITVISKQGPHKTSAMQRLIPDVLALIFDYATKVDTFGKMLEVATQMQTLAVVCKHWREVALSNPLLWNQIGAAELSERSAARVDLHIMLSRDVPLSLCMGMEIPPDFQYRRKPVYFTVEELPLYERVCDMLNVQQKRWKNLSMRFSRLLESSGHHLVLDDLQIVENLMLDTPILVNECHGTPSLCLDLSNSPRLKISTLQGDVKMCSTSHYALNRLESLQLDHHLPYQPFPTVADCLTLLSTTSNLERLKVYPSCPDSPSNASPVLPHLVLEKLYILDMGAHGKRSAIAPLLAQLTLPAFRILHITNDVIYSSLASELVQSSTTSYGLPELLLRSRAPLETFDMYSIIEHEPNIIEMLRHMPHLRSLRLYRCLTLSKNILLALGSESAEDGKLRLCPNLECITLSECHLNFPHRLGTSSDEAIDAAVEMVRARWVRPDGKRTLTHVNVMHCGLSEMLFDHSIQKMVSEGLQLLCTEENEH